MQSEEAPRASALKRMRVEDLRTLLSEHDLNTKGRKASLVDRLIDHMANG